MSKHVSFLCSIHLLSFHPSVLPQAQKSGPVAHFESPGRRTICWLHQLPHLTDIFVLVPTDNCIFAIFHVWVRICLTITIHWPGGYHIRRSLDRNGSFLIDGWFYLVRDSIRSKIHQHIFKSPDWCFICWWHHLPHHTELFRFSQAIVFSPFHTCLSFVISEYISFLLCSVFFPSFHPSVLPQAQWSNPPTHFLVAWPAHNLLFADLPHLTDIFDFVSQDNCIFPSLFTF